MKPFWKRSPVWKSKRRVVNRKAFERWAARHPEERRRVEERALTLAPAENRGV